MPKRKPPPAGWTITLPNGNLKVIPFDKSLPHQKIFRGEEWPQKIWQRQDFQVRRRHGWSSPGHRVSIKDPNRGTVEILREHIFVEPYRLMPKRLWKQFALPNAHCHSVLFGRQLSAYSALSNPWAQFELARKKNFRPNLNIDVSMDWVMQHAPSLAIRSRYATAKREG